MDYRPLFAERDLDARWIVTREGYITARRFRYQVDNLQRSLPQKKYCVLICESRARFMLGFAAALLRRQTILLPPNRTQNAVTELTANYPDSYCLDDAYVGPFEAAALADGADAADVRLDEIPVVETDHLAAIVFTSGSTGKPKASPKYWDELFDSTLMAQKRFGFDEGKYIVATVPPQHMYGFETSVLVPMLTGAAVCGVSPFYPDDVRQMFLRISGERVLITTPFHLRAYTEAGLDWPDVHRIISATAPLDKAVATQAERKLNAPVHEIFGSTETGSVASRRSLWEESWTMYDGLSIKDRSGTAMVIAPCKDEEVALSDAIEVEDETHFCWKGRATDMIKVAGNRASLSDLNLKLNSIPGIVDGVLVQPREDGEVSRLIAVVVAPTLSEDEILEALGKTVDRVFLPRSIYFVDRLPRVETGKLPRSALLDLLQTLSKRNDLCA